MKKIVRIKLSDFIGTEVETDIFYFLEKISDVLNDSYEIRFWYYSKELKSEDVEAFRSKYTDQIKKYFINIHQFSGHEDFAWYDITSYIEGKKMRKFKFRSFYDKSHDIPRCLIEFKMMVKFNSSQARNSLRVINHDKNRSNWIKKTTEQKVSEGPVVRPQEKVE